MAAVTADSLPKIEARFATWMDEVIEQHAAAARALEVDTVHDLRVALRRCLSMAEIFQSLDPSPAWRDMRKHGRLLFKRLGRLRDAQVLLDWIGRIGPEPGPLSEALSALLDERRNDHEEEARKALGQFSEKRWKLWAEQLTVRAARLPADGLAAQYLAVERWEQAWELHRKAVHSSSHAAFHRTRIGLKRFRYTLENLLPIHAAPWLATIRKMQDALGEIHDLDLLVAALGSLRGLGSPEERQHWERKIAAFAAGRIEAYRSLSARGSEWRLWRNGLPRGEMLEAAALAWLSAWASFLTPDLRHARHVRKLALQLYDQLTAAGLGGAQGNGHTRRVLEMAALAHDVGRARGGRSHHKRSFRMIAGLKAPLGWTPEEMRLAALVARYHRRALPQTKHAEFRRLRPDRRQKVLLLAGILRLANALDRDHDASVRSLKAQIGREGIAIRAGGYLAVEPRASYIANARRLFEIACRRPVAVLPGV